MNIEVLAFIGLSALVVIVFLMVYLRDIEVNKKLLIYEKSIEELNYQNHVLNKLVTELSNKPAVDEKEIEERLMVVIKEQITHKVTPVVNSLQGIEKIIQNFRDEQISRIDRLESRTKEMSMASSLPSSSNENMILSQYAKGRSEAEIAKDLRIGIGEVDLVLKLANLK